MGLITNRSNNITSILNINLFNMINNFNETKNLDIAIRELIKNTCDIFDIDRAIFIRRDNLQNEYIPIMEYEKIYKKVVYFDKDVNFNTFVDVSMVESTNSSEEEYISICKNNSYFNSSVNKDEIFKIKDVLKNLNYISKNYIVKKEEAVRKKEIKEKKIKEKKIKEKKIKEKEVEYNTSELITYYIKDDALFTYIVFERYNIDENSNFSESRRHLFTKEELLILKTIYDTLKIRLKSDASTKRMHNEKSMKEAIINNEKMPICMVSQSDHKILFFNELYKQILPNVRIGGYCYSLFGKPESCIRCCTEAVRLQNHLGSNDKYWIKKSVPFTVDGGLEVYMIYAKDTTDYIKQLEGIDLLTSAYSIKGFSEYFNKVVYGGSTPFSLCTIDIDKFKYINNSFGYDVGNNILKKVASVISNFIETPEAFCRINEDKFAIIFLGEQEKEIAIKLESLICKLEDMQQEYFLDKKITYIAGVSKIDRSLKLNILLDHANIARKSVKGSHKSTFAFYDDKAELKIKKEISLEEKISEAVDNDEFIPYLQPKFKLDTMEICGAEALVRWISPQGMIFPDEFIPLFERNGFIATLDFIVYKKIMQHIRNCIDNNLTVYPISLNVSRSHIQNKNFVNQIMELIHEYDIPLYLLELEITESIFVEDKEKLKYFIQNIKRPNIKVSIDDFGTAYSSLQVLKDIDVDVLKIDKGFLDNIDFTNSRKFTKDEVVLKNIINLASDLNCKVICEGVETKEQVELLKSIGCEYGQGYVFARPMPIIEYEEQYLKNNK